MFIFVILPLVVCRHRENVGFDKAGWHLTKVPRFNQTVTLWLRLSQTTRTTTFSLFINCSPLSVCHILPSLFSSFFPPSSLYSSVRLSVTYAATVAWPRRASTSIGYPTLARLPSNAQWGPAADALPLTVPWRSMCWPTSKERSASPKTDPAFAVRFATRILPTIPPSMFTWGHTLMRGPLR